MLKKHKIEEKIAIPKKIEDKKVLSKKIKEKIVIPKIIEEKKVPLKKNITFPAIKAKVTNTTSNKTLPLTAKTNKTTMNISFT